MAKCIGLAVALSFAGPAYCASADLRNLDLEDLLKIQVVGASKYEQPQADVPAAVVVITREEIRRFGWRTIGEALQTLPGFFQTYDRQYAQLGSRGLGVPGDYNQRVLFTINGNRINDPVFDAAPSGRDFPLDINLVERIEVIPGPGSAVYGQNAMFGVVNVITRKGSDLSGVEAGLELQHPQDLREARLSWGGLLDNGLDVLVSVSGLKSRGEDLALSFGRTGVQGLARNLDGERDAQAYLRVARGSWDFEWTHGDRRKDDPTGSYLSDPLVPGQYQSDMYSTGQLRYQGLIASDWELNAKLFGGARRYTSILQYGGAVYFPTSGTYWGTEWRLSTTRFDRHRVMLGFELQDNFQIEQGVQRVANATGILDVKTPNHRLGVFLQDEWRILPALTANLGLRADRNAGSSSTLNPRAALIWQVSGLTTIKALYGGAHRLPNAYESSYADGLSSVSNPLLRQERIETTELTADHRISSNLIVRGSIYRWTLRDLITLGVDPISGLAQYQNGSRRQAEGAEISADRTWSSGLRLRGNASYSNQTIASGDPATNSPRWLARGLLSAPLPGNGWRLAYEVRYDDRRRTTLGGFTGGQLVSDLRLESSTLLPHMDLALKALNLFDRRYAQPTAESHWQSSLEQDGRSIALQIQTRF